MDNKPFNLTDGEKAAPPPPVWPPQPAPLPSGTNANGHAHSETIAWPAAQNDVQLPFKNTR